MCTVQVYFALYAISFNIYRLRYEPDSKPYFNTAVNVLRNILKIEDVYDDQQ